MRCGFWEFMTPTLTLNAPKPIAPLRTRRGADQIIGVPYGYSSPRVRPQGHSNACHIVRTEQFDAEKTFLLGIMFFLIILLQSAYACPWFPTGGKRRGTSIYKCVFVSFAQYSVWQCSVYFNIPPYWFFAFAFCAYLKLEAWSKITSSFIRSLRYIWLLGAGSASLWSLSVNNTVYWDFLTLILFGPI
jgi:hypothetical protein